jgi:hypothetical protein
MALQIVFETQMGFIAEQAYAKISSYRGNKLDLQVNVLVYKDINSTDKQELTTLQKDLHISNGATMQEMYNALKLLPEFAGAIDV